MLVYSILIDKVIRFFLIAIQYNQKKSCSSPTAKELNCPRSYLSVSTTPASLSALIKHILLFHGTIYFHGMKKQKELNPPACQAKAEVLNILIHRLLINILPLIKWFIV